MSLTGVGVERTLSSSNYGRRRQGDGQSEWIPEIHGPGRPDCVGELN
jgi:hypothetical protein